METSTSPIMSPEYKDRKTGLVIFGILTILLGMVSLLSGVFICVSAIIFQSHGNSTLQPVSGTILAMAIGVNGAIAVKNIWLGIGSILARRWARALLLIVSWIWLIMGIIIVGGMGILFPKILKNMPPTNPEAHLPAHFNQLMLFLVLAFYAVVLVLLPLIWVFFYGRKSVKATCEARNPQPSWTDRCPLPVLAASLWLLFSGIITLMLFVKFGRACPFFGAILTGMPAMTVYAVMAAISLYCGYGFYKLDRTAWWIAVVFLGIRAISTVITYSRHSLMEIAMATQASATPESMAVMKQYNQMNSVFLWFGGLSLLAVFLYLLWIRKFFVKKSA